VTEDPRVCTFSIVACDLDSREWGVAVASKFLAVGAVVPWAQAEVGAVATQSYANTGYGPAGLALMAGGRSAQETLESLLSADEQREQRQVGIVDGAGGAATFTGSQCYDWAGGRGGAGYAAQGNILTGPGVVDALAETFEAATGALADRLLSALSAGDAAGGDSRGRQGAALYVARAGAGYGGFNDRFVDLRVDDHPDPVAELQRLLRMHTLYFQRTRAADIQQVDAPVAGEIQQILRVGGFDTPATGVYDASMQEHLRALYGRENLEQRWIEPPAIDRVALEFLREKYRT
jgi:uncharacterized Ntn-hydrolase superfamily protein